MVIIMDTEPSRQDLIHGRGGHDLAPPGTVATIAEQGDAFDTAGRTAEAVLVSCARAFIDLEGLSGTDPESLALAAADTPELRDALLALRDCLLPRRLRPVRAR
jgi:hypothetical protein